MKPSIEEHTQILRDISKNPLLSQREIALRNRMSLGKVNYAIRSLIDKGFIKIQNFSGSQNKRKYMYLLTPAGLYENTRRTRDFLKWKMDEYERLKQEIQELKADVGTAEQQGLPSAQQNHR